MGFKLDKSLIAHSQNLCTPFNPMYLIGRENYRPNAMGLGVRGAKEIKTKHKELTNVGIWVLPG